MNTTTEHSDSETQRALKRARAIEDPWYRTQALAKCARYAPDNQVEPLAREARRTSLQTKDAYQEVGSAAWPIRALVERGSLRLARELLVGLRIKAQEIEPPGSRSEALLLLFNAAFALGPEVRESLIADLAQAARIDSSHWRAGRNLARALGLLSRVQPDLAQEILETMNSERSKRQALAAMDDPDYTNPREFFP